MSFITFPGQIALNTSFGAGALSANTTGTYNTAFGNVALSNNRAGGSNTGVGSGAIANNLNGSLNTALGFNALGSSSNPNTCVAIGYQALQVSEGTANTAIGPGAGSLLTTGQSNTIVGGFTGNQGGVDIRTSSNNIVISDGNGNPRARYLSSTSSWTFDGLSIPTYLNSNTLSVGSCTVGFGPGNVSSNAALGSSAMSALSTSANCVAIGSQALSSVVAGGARSTAVGAQSIIVANTPDNTGVGYRSLFQASGAYNTSLGSQAGSSVTSGSGNVILGSITSTGATSPVFNVTTESDRFVAGSTSVTNAYVQVAWTVVSDARDKTDFAPVPLGLDFVCRLKPTAYRYKETRESEVGHGPLRYGFKAQDILALEIEHGEPVIIDAEDPEKLRMNDQHLIATLVQAIQELKREIDTLKAARI